MSGNDQPGTSPRLQSLRVRVLLLVLLILLPAFGLLLYGSHQLRQARVADVERSARRLAQAAAIEQNRLLEGAYQLLTAMARLPQVWQATPDCSQLFSQLLRELPQYANLGAAHPDGLVYCSALPFRVPLNISDRAYFHEARDSRRFAITHLERGRLSGEPSVVIGYPVLGSDGRQVMAVVYGALDLTSMRDLASRADLPLDAVFLLVTAEGTVLASSPSSAAPAGSDLQSPALLYLLETSREGAARLQELDEVDRVYGWSAVASGAEADQLFVVVGLPAAEAFADVNRFTLRSLLLLVGLGGIGLIAAWLGGKHFVLQPIRTLAGTATRLQAGDLTARTGLRTGRGELSELAGTFDAMADSLERSNDALRSRASELQAIATSASALVRELEIEDVAKVVVQEMLDSLQADHAVLWLLDDEGQELQLVAQKGFPPQVAGALAIVPLDAQLPMAVAARERLPLLIDDLFEEKGFPQATAIARRTGARSVLNLPLSFRGNLVGVLSVGREERAAFPLEQQRLATALGDLFAAAVENARLFRRVQEALWLREAFLAAAAHELRTPATSLKSYTQLMLRRDSRSEKDRRTLSRMASLAERTAHLARELEEAHALSRGLQLNIDTFSWREVVLHAMAVVQERYEGHRLLLCSGGDTTIAADHDRLSMTIEALLENAIRYQPGGGDVQLTLEGDEREVAIEIRDFGAGIPPDRLPHVFEPLFEPWPPGSPYYTGVVGLGLYLAKAVAVAHGGDLVARSEEEGGSTFRLSLPRTPPSDGEPIGAPFRAEDREGTPVGNR